MDIDFELVLAILTLVTGVIALADRILFIRRQPLSFSDRNYLLTKIVDFSRSFFPVFALVLIIRSFLFEPFRIPSGSMIPTLLIGDFILVNKFSYGVRLPVIRNKIIDTGSPQRGDVVVFRYPVDNKTPFIKRIIGIPGDEVKYINKKLYINGEEINREVQGRYLGVGASRQYLESVEYLEKLGGQPYRVIVRTDSTSIDSQFIVPKGKYFVLGDNRDNSRDSRFWGFVSERNLMGKAFLVWMNWDDGVNLDRVGAKIF